MIDEVQLLREEQCRAASAPAAPAEQTEIDRITGRARAVLSQGTFDEAYRGGTAMTFEDLAAALD